MTPRERNDLITNLIPDFTGDPADTPAVVAAAAAAGVLADITAVLLDTCTTPTRPDLPLTAAISGGKCPTCGEDLLHVTDSCDRWWSVRGLNDDGTGIEADGIFEWDDGGSDEHVECFACGAEWETPKETAWV